MTRGRVFIVGAGGMLGGEMSEYLENESDWRGSAIGEVRRISHIDNRDFASCAAYRIKTEHGTACVNCAAMTDTAFAENSYEGRAASWFGNVELPAKLAAGCKEAGARLIHFSTDYVFGGKPAYEQPISDEHEPSPIGIYGLHKLAGETAIMASGADYAIFRTSWLYGRHNEKSFVHKFSRALVQALSLGKAVEVPDDERSVPTPTSALVAATAIALENDLRGVIHAVPRIPRGETAPSRYDWAKAIGDLMHDDWQSRKLAGFSSWNEDAIWEKYDDGSIVKKPGGRVDEWRPAYSAMLVSSCIRPIFKDWKSHLGDFLAKYGASWSRKICESAVKRGQGQTV